MPLIHVVQLLVKNHLCLHIASNYSYGNIHPLNFYLLLISVCVREVIFRKLRMRMEPCRAACKGRCAARLSCRKTKFINLTVQLTSLHKTASLRKGPQKNAW